MEKPNKKKHPFWKKAGAFALEILVELMAAALFLAIGAGILFLLGNWESVSSIDPELLILLGALVVLAAFGVVFAVVATVRKMKKKKAA